MSTHPTKSNPLPLSLGLDPDPSMTTRRKPKLSRPSSSDMSKSEPVEEDQDQNQDDDDDNDDDDAGDDQHQHQYQDPHQPDQDGVKDLSSSLPPIPEEEDDDEDADEEDADADADPLPPPPTEDAAPPPAPASRRGSKRKKPSRRQRATVQRRMELLRRHFRPVPFCPPLKTLATLSRHEALLRSLGLWDFAHLDLDRDLRSDLLVGLIANYDPNARCSYVHDHRINVSRPLLARALRLPLKKDLPADPSPPSADAAPALLEFVSGYMLLHEDTWIMPPEILSTERQLKEGQPHKVDWAGLMWTMVERELSQAPETGNCFYASHLQCLIRSQKPDVFREVQVQEVSLVGDDDHATIPKAADVEETRPIELGLGQESNEARENIDEGNTMDVEECEKQHQHQHQQGQRMLGEKGVETDPSLRHCNFNVLGSSKECERVDKEEEDEEVEEEDDDEGRYESGMKFPKLERLESADLIQDMDANNVSYGLNGNLVGPSSSELLTPRDDLHKNIFLNSGSLSMYGNACKREMNDEDVVNISHSDHHRKMKSDGPWDHSLEGFVMCMDQAQSWLNKARAMYEEKEEAFGRANMQMDYLIAQVQQRDNIIHAMEKNVLEERSQKQVEIYRLEHELCVMTQLLHGYKKALKDTRAAFAEYRAKFGQPDEPIYKDAGKNGVVLTVMELEKKRLEREDEERNLRMAIEEKVKEFEVEWLGHFQSQVSQVDVLEKRLVKIGEEVGILKQNRKTRDPST